MRLALERGASEPLVVLALGAHSDDIEIGCGGTILRLAESRPGLEVVWAVLAAEGEREAEARASATAFLAGVAKATVVTRSFRESFFPYVGAEVKGFFEELKGLVDPDLVLTHHRGDLHQDHRLVAELTGNTFRNHLVLEYEIPKYDADLGSPNVFVTLHEETCRRKVAALMEHFPSQRERHWFTEDLFLSLLRLRGVESASPTGYAEAFHSRKIVL